MIPLHFRCATPQGLRPARHSSKFPPRTKRIRGTDFLSKLMDS